MYSWSLFEMVTQSMLRTHGGNQVFSGGGEHLICACSRSDQRLQTDQIHRMLLTFTMFNAFTIKIKYVDFSLSLTHPAQPFPFPHL